MEKKKEMKAPGFTKEQLSKTKCFAEQRDILQVVLKDGSFYTIPQAEKLVEQFLKRKVK